MARVVVLGGGFGGMAAAVRLAKLGHQVTMSERRTTLGGAMHALEQDGFRWDAGPALTTLPAVIRDLFRKSGRPLEREVELVPLSPARRHWFDDGTVLDLPAGSRAEQIAAMSEVLGPREARGWAGLIDGQAPVWDVMRRRWLESPFPGTRLDRATSGRSAPAGRSPRSRNGPPPTTGSGSSSSGARQDRPVRDRRRTPRSLSPTTTSSAPSASGRSTAACRSSPTH